jgi:outer membrane protein
MSAMLVVVLAGLLQSAAGTADVLTLRQAVQEALNRGQSLASANDRVEISEMQVRVAESRFGLKIAPTLGAGAEPTGLLQQNAGVTLSRRLPTGMEITARADSVKYQTGTSHARDAGYTIAVSQPLLRGAGRAARADLDDARSAVAASKRSREEARQDGILQVAQAYFAIVRQERLLTVGQRALDRARALLATSEARAKVGLVTQVDVLRAELVAAQAESALASSVQALQDATDVLKVLLGRPLTSDIAVASGEIERVAALPLSANADVSLDALIAEALSRRPLLEDARAQVERAAHAARIASWNLRPQLDVTASFTRRGLGNAESDVLNRLWGGWRLGFTSSYNVDRASVQANAAAATVSSRAATRAAADTERRVTADVLQAYRSWQRAASAVTLQEKAAALAEKQRQLAQLRYDRGLAGNFDVVDADASLLQAQSSLVAAQIDRALAAIGVRRATGTLSLEDLPQ